MKKYDKKTLDLIRTSEYFNSEWYLNSYLKEAVDLVDPLTHYIETGASLGFDPSPKFNTKGYIKAYNDVARAGINPLVHFIKSGFKEGRSPTGDFYSDQSTRPRMPRFGPEEYGRPYAWLEYDRPLKNKNLEKSICVHLHLFHVDMLNDFIFFLKNIPYKFTLLVSVCDNNHRSNESIFHKNLVNLEKVIFRLLPNKGRDVASWVVGFSDLIQEFDFFCHIHSKRSDYNKSYSGWRQFLLHGVLGGPAVVEQIVELLNDDEVGIVSPPYYGALPGQPRWGANQDLCLDLLRKMEITYKSNQCPDFPAGSFFWARVDVLAPIFSKLSLTYDDFEDELGQLDGTLGHSIERILGVLPSKQGRKFAMVGVDVSYNLTNYWDSNRVDRYSRINPDKRLSLKAIWNNELINNFDINAKVAVLVCATGGFDGSVCYPVIESGVDYYFITDNSIRDTNIEVGKPFKWLPARYTDINPRRTARFVKTHPHLYLDGYDYVVWLDANIIPVGGVLRYVSDVMHSKADIGLVRHPTRTSWILEAQECARIGADDAELLKDQTAKYVDLGMKDEGLIETNFIVANLKSEDVKKFYGVWWNEIASYSLRDQVSVNFALNISKLKVHYLFLEGRSVRDTSGFLIFSHDFKGKEFLN
jgi:hypothetical protein